MRFLQNFSVVVILAMAACGTGETNTELTQDVTAKSCSLSAVYQFAYMPGFRYPYQFEQTTLSPAHTFTHTLEKDQPPVYSCENEIPDCYSRTVARDTITTAHLIAAFADADVQSAFANSGVAFNRDPRIADSPVYQVKLEKGAVFYVGFDNCATAGVKGCYPAPAGVSKLIDLLVRLDAQQLAASKDCRQLVSQR